MDDTMDNRVFLKKTGSMNGKPFFIAEPKPADDPVEAYISSLVPVCLGHGKL
jgi:hypothetical protein